MAKLALEGLRVIELGWLEAEPVCSMLLADMGAEVLKAETRVKLDGARVTGSWKDNIPNPPEGSGDYESWNRNKKSFLLNLRTPQGIDVLKRLVKISDIVTENWSAGTMEEMGIGYEVLKEANEKIIVVRLGAFGQTGPYCDRPSYGPILQAFGGFASLIAYSKDEIPTPSAVIYDRTAGIFSCFLIMAALEHRRKTGKGQCIDVSQYEIGVSMAGHLILDSMVNNRSPELIGNRHPYACPHGCYRCKGEDKWCTIAVFDEREWESFCNVVGDPRLTGSAKYATVIDRKRNEDELDKLIEEWTVTRESEEVMHLLQQAGIAAGVVQNLADQLYRDPHMKERAFYLERPTSVLSEFVYDGTPYKFSATPGSVRTAAPLLGEHTDHVLKDILKMPDEEIEVYARAGAFS